jgi:ribosomal-protein-alanine N-acetyltransferase
MICIRAGQPEDLESVDAISRASLPQAWSRESLSTELDHHPTARFLVAADEGQVIGFIHWWMVLDEGQIMNLAVSPDHRNHGTGRALLDAAIRTACEAGAVSMVLDVREGNSAARNLYQSAGFQVVAVRRGYYADNGENALFMQRYFVQM